MCLFSVCAQIVVLTFVLLFAFEFCFLSVALLNIKLCLGAYSRTGFSVKWFCFSYVTTSYHGFWLFVDMAERLTEMVKAFDGSSSEVACWLKKVKLVVQLKKVGDLATFIPLYLEGPAFEVYDQMAENDKEDADKIEETLLNAFGQNSFDAYDSFRQRSWIVGEAVDVFLADLRRLARLAKVEDDILLLRAFVVGLPSDVASQVRATADIENSTLDRVLQLARVLIANRTNGIGLAVTKPTMKIRNTGCFKCGEQGHVAKFCTSNVRQLKKGLSDVVCYRCGGKGHISRNCSVKESGKLDAPAASQGM